MCSRKSFVLLLVILVCCGSLFAWPSMAFHSSEEQLVLKEDAQASPLALAPEQTETEPSESLESEPTISMPVENKSAEELLSLISLMKLTKTERSKLLTQTQAVLTEQDAIIADYDAALATAYEDLTNVEKAEKAFHYGAEVYALYTPTVNLLDAGVGVDLRLRKQNFTSAIGVILPSIVKPNFKDLTYKVGFGFEF